MRNSSMSIRATAQSTARVAATWSAAVVTVLALAAMLIAGSKPAEANWLAPKQVVENADIYLKTSVGLPDGSAWLIWYDGNTREIWAQKISASGTPLPSTLMLLRDNAEFAAYLSADVSSEGEVTVAWRRLDEANQSLVEARRISPEGELDPDVYTLRSTNALLQRVKVATRPDGVSTVIWEDGTLDDVVTRRIDSDGTIGPIVEWITADVASGEPSIVAAPEGSPKEGEFYVTWIQIDRDPNDFNKASYVVHGQSLLANGNKGTHNILTPASDIRVVSNYFPIPHYLSDGSTIVTWQRDAVGSGIVARRVSPAGVPAPETEPFPVSNWVPRDHMSVVDSEDRLTVMYAVGLNYSLFEYRVRTLHPDGSLGPALDPFGVATTDAWLEDMALTITPTDDLFVGGMIYFDESEYPDEPDSLRFRHIKPDGTLGEMKTLGEEYYGPDLAPGAGGTVHAIFDRWISGTQGLWTMRYDPNATGELKINGISSKPKKVKRGKSATVTVKVKNTGDVAVSSVKVCTRLSKSLKKVLGNKCVKAGTIAAGKTKSVKVKVKVKPKAKTGKTYKPKFTVTGNGVKKAVKTGKVKVAG